ncbi:MAG TPA: monofunctional biosynthetic peptidoglycan transglycosylase [Vicinamibacterales bacterium]|nr:monofunctional biosynthetic peptidoglycan transglycosylase [Vicinamibacterales bacterium]
MVRTIGRALVAAAAVGFGVLAYVYLTLPDVRPLAHANPKTTAFMELRAQEAARDGKTLRHVQVWVPYSRISPHLKRAVLVAEDDAFWQHEGIDVEQLRQSIEEDLARGAAVRGGSTITQQLAKNLYLSPSRNPLRKIRELILARRLEAELTKARIFELYLNVIEWGDGIWGAEAAARTYFHTSAASLSREQAALLAGAIVNPRVLTPAHPTARLLRRQRIILTRMGGVEPPPVVPASEVPEPPSAAPSLAPDEEPAPAQPEPTDSGAPPQVDPPAPPASLTPAAPAS